MHERQKKIALIHRYGLEGWICCGGHAIPEVIRQLSSRAEIHFYGPETTEAHDPALRDQMQLHKLPYTWNRANPTDKITKTLLWYFWLPLIGLHCRIREMDLIWNDETVPLTAPILRLFYGGSLAITVMDFFARIYTEKHPRLRWLCTVIEQIDLQSWKRLPILFTKVFYTQDFLSKQGVPKSVMHLYRNPIDHTKFHPVPSAVREDVRKKFGFSDQDIVLSHHGILHPNKGNEWIIRRIAELKNTLPLLKFLLIGDGPELDNLRRLADELGITNQIVFAGWLRSEKELNEALASSDIGLVMRIGQETDHFHMTDTLAHEIACGKPVLAVRLKGIAEVITDQENGFLFSPDNPDEFKEKLIQLATDWSVRTTAGARALQTSLEVCDTLHSAVAISAPIQMLLEKNSP